MAVFLPLLPLLVLAGLLRITVYLPGPTAGTLDLRSDSGQPGAWVAFCARGESICGHAFVLLGDGAEDITAVRWNEAYGLYPKEGIGLLGTVQPLLIAEDPESSVGRLTHRLAVRVDADRAERVRKLLAETEAGGRFRVMGVDCITALQRIAAELGLKTPPRFSHPMPQAWVRSLIAANT